MDCPNSCCTRGIRFAFKIRWTIDFYGHNYSNGTKAPPFASNLKILRCTSFVQKAIYSDVSGFSMRISFTISTIKESAVIFLSRFYIFKLVYDVIYLVLLVFERYETTPSFCINIFRFHKSIIFQFLLKFSFSSYQSKFLLYLNLQYKFNDQERKSNKKCNNMVNRVNFRINSIVWKIWYAKFQIKTVWCFIYGCFQLETQIVAARNKWRLLLCCTYGKCSYVPNKIHS